MIACDTADQAVRESSKVERRDKVAEGVMWSKREARVGRVEVSANDHRRVLITGQAQMMSTSYKWNDSDAFRSPLGTVLRRMSTD